MKQAFFIIVSFFFLICKINSQIPQDNHTYTDNYIDKFIGSWTWSAGDDTVKLKFKKFLVSIPGFTNSYWDRLIGCHGYTQNGVSVESTLQQYDSLQYYEIFPNIASIILYRFADDDTAYVGGTMKDITTNKSVHIELLYRGGSPEMIEMKLSYREGVTASFPGRPYIPGFTLPQNIILTKE